MNKRTLLLLSLLVVSPAAFAMDAEYVVMGGFTTIVNAFTRIKFIFNDNQYQALVTAFVVMGMISALLLKSARGGLEFLETGKGQMGVGWLGFTILGTMMYFGLVQPKGTIHIYDQSRNQYQAVSGIPDFLILTAGVTNQVYQAVVEISNRDTASTTRFTGEGTPIKMLLGVLNRSGAQYDSYLRENIKSMWNQCEPIAETRGFDPRVLKSGSSVLDVISALSPLRNQATYTTWVSPSVPSGVAVTCEQAYLSLRSDLGNPAAYSARLQDVCSKNGYNVVNASQLADCKGRMESGFQTIFGASGLSLSSAMSNIVVSQAITDAMMQNNPDVATTMLTNRAMINGGMADALTNPEWLSFIMAGVLAIILCITPMLLLLVFTPLMMKALVLLFGLWIFITTWQIADAMLLQAGTDEILTAMSEIKSMGLGIDAVQMGPSAAMKAMAVMASARESAVQIAMLVAGICGVSAFGIGALGQKAMGRLDKVNEESAEKTLTQEGRGHQLNSMRQGAATEKTFGEFGGNIDALSNASAFNDSRDVYNAGSQINALGGMGSAAQRTGSVDAGRAVGSTKGYEGGNAGSGYTMAESTSMTQTETGVGDSAGRRDSAEAQNMSVSNQMRLNSGVTNTMQTADSKSSLGIAGGNLSDLNDQQGSLHNVERQAQIGAAQGTQQAADTTGKSVTDFSKDRTSVDATNDHASGQGQLQAAGGTLSGLHSRTQSVSSTESAQRKGNADALHIAYGSNAGIEQGVAESQGEHLTQNSHDMREQKANVKEIQAATGKSESDSRDLLAAGRSAEQMGVLEGNGYSPKQVQENTAYSTEKGAAVIAGEQTAYNERGVQMVDTAHRRGEIETHQGISDQGAFNTVSKGIGGDKAATDAKAGANTVLAVTKPEAENLRDNQLITETQADAVPQDGVGVVHMSRREDAEGNNISTGSLQTGNNTTVDNSWRNDSGQTLGTEISAQQNLQDYKSVEGLINATERANPGSAPLVVGAEAARSLSPILQQHSNSTSQQTIRGGVDVGDGGVIGGLGKVLGVKLNAGVGADHISADGETYNKIAGAFSQKVGQFQTAATKEADVRGMQGADREEFINQTTAIRTSALYNEALAVTKQNAESASSGSIINDISTPKPVGSSTQPTQADETGFSRNGVSSPQEMVEQMRRQQHAAALSEQTIKTSDNTSPQGTPAHISAATSVSGVNPVSDGRGMHNQNTTSEQTGHVGDAHTTQNSPATSNSMTPGYGESRAPDSASNERGIHNPNATSEQTGHVGDAHTTQNSQATSNSMTPGYGESRAPDSATNERGIHNTNATSEKTGHVGDAHTTQNSQATSNSMTPGYGESRAPDSATNERGIHNTNATSEKTGHVGDAHTTQNSQATVNSMTPGYGEGRTADSNVHFNEHQNTPATPEQTGLNTGGYSQSDNSQQWANQNTGRVAKSENTSVNQDESVSQQEDTGSSQHPPIAGGLSGAGVPTQGGTIAKDPKVPR